MFRVGTGLSHAVCSLRQQSADIKKFGGPLLKAAGSSRNIGPHHNSHIKKVQTDRTGQGGVTGNLVLISNNQLVLCL